MCHAQTRPSHQHLDTSCLAQHCAQTCSQALHKSACPRIFRRPALCVRLLLCSFCTTFLAECWIKGCYRCKHFSSGLARSHYRVDLLRKLLCESWLCVCAFRAVCVCHVVPLFFCFDVFIYYRHVRCKASGNSWLNFLQRKSHSLTFA